MKLFSISTGLVSLLGTMILAAAAYAGGSPGGSTTTAAPRPCFKIYSPVCTDCPGYTNDYCWPNKKGPFKSCTQLAPVEACRDGFCAQADPGPTGCQIWTPGGQTTSEKEVLGKR